MSVIRYLQSIHQLQPGSLQIVIPDADYKLKGLGDIFLYKKTKQLLVIIKVAGGHEPDQNSATKSVLKASIAL